MMKREGRKDEVLSGRLEDDKNPEDQEIGLQVLKFISMDRRKQIFFPPSGIRQSASGWRRQELSLRQKKKGAPAPLRNISLSLHPEVH